MLQSNFSITKSINPYFLFRIPIIILLFDITMFSDLEKISRKKNLNKFLKSILSESLNIVTANKKIMTGIRERKYGFIDYLGSKLYQPDWIFLIFFSTVSRSLTTNRFPSILMPPLVGLTDYLEQLPWYRAIWSWSM